MVFSATIGAVLALIVIATPIDRAGSSIVQNLLDKYAPNAPSTLEILELNLGVAEANEVVEPVEEPTPPTLPRFIVRFDENVPAKTAMRSFRENRTLGRQQFADWVASDDRFSGFQLEGLTLSGEAIVSYTGLGADKINPELLRHLTRQLMDAPDVIYADPFQFIGLAR